MPDTWNVGKSAAVGIYADTANQKKIINAHGGTLYYKTTSAVSTSDSSLATGESLTVEQPYWVISNTECTVIVEAKIGETVQDSTITDQLTVSGATTLTGAATLTGGIVSGAPGFYAGGWNPVAATSGTDTTPAEKKLFVTSIFLPVNKKIKGIGYLVGSVGGTNKVVAGLWSSAGEILAHSSETTEGATVGTAAEIQELNLSAEYSAVGPAVYFIGITMNGNTARFRSIPKNTAGSNVMSEEITIAAKNVLAKITAPTAFTADKGPISWVY